jgi:putative ABC transport system substrate-binding protein
MGTRPCVVAIVAALSTALLAADLGAQSPGKAARIGFLHPGTPPNANVDVFRRALREIGYLEGQNIAIEFRWADGQLERLPRLAAELVDLKADVIVVGSTPAIKGV